MRDAEGVVEFFAGITLGVLVTFIATYCCRDRAWKEDALSRGVAAYDQQTGDWHWTVEPKKPEAK